MISFKNIYRPAVECLIPNISRHFAQSCKSLVIRRHHVRVCFCQGFLSSEPGDPDAGGGEAEPDRERRAGGGGARAEPCEGRAVLITLPHQCPVLSLPPNVTCFRHFCECFPFQMQHFTSLRFIYPLLYSRASDVSVSLRHYPSLISTISFVFFQVAVALCLWKNILYDDDDVFMHLSHAQT